MFKEDKTKKRFCPKCEKKFPYTLEFWGKNGKKTQTYCRKCKKQDDRIYSRKYRAEHPEWKKKDNKRNAKLIQLLVTRYIKENPERLRATSAVTRAIKSGKIIRKPCVVCGETKTHGHHKDYEKPLKVMWLCALHHRAIHNPL